MKLIDRIAEHITSELLENKEVQNDIIKCGLERLSFYSAEIKIDDNEIELIFRDPTKIFPDLFDVILSLKNDDIIKELDREQYFQNLIEKIVNFTNENLLFNTKLTCERNHLLKITFPNIFLLDPNSDKQEITSSIKQLILEDYNLKEKIYEIILENDVEQVFEILNLETFIDEVGDRSLYNHIYKGKINKSGLKHELNVINNIIQATEEHLILDLKRRMK